MTSFLLPSARTLQAWSRSVQQLSLRGNSRAGRHSFFHHTDHPQRKLQNKIAWEFFDLAACTVRSLAGPGPDLKLPEHSYEIPNFTNQFNFYYLTRNNGDNDKTNKNTDFEPTRGIFGDHG